MFFLGGLGGFHLGKVGIFFHRDIKTPFPQPREGSLWRLLSGVINLHASHDLEVGRLVFLPFVVTNMGVSKNRGTPKRMVSNGKPY